VSLGAILASISVVSAAGAQEEQDEAIDGEFSVQRFRPAPGPRNFVNTVGARQDGNMAFSASLMVNYAYKPFVVVSCASEDDCEETSPGREDIPVVENLVTADVMGSFTPIPALQIGLRVPVSYVKGQGLNEEGSADEDTGQQFPNGPGEAYVYQLTPGGWQATATLVGSAAEPDAFFGYSVAFGGPDPDLPSFAVIGAPDEGPGDESDTCCDPPGGAYLFRNDGGTWSEASRLPWPGPSTSQEYGREVAASDDTAFVFQPGGVSPGDSGTNTTIHDVGMCTP